MRFLSSLIFVGLIPVGGACLCAIPGRAWASAPATGTASHPTTLGTITVKGHRLPDDRASGIHAYGEAPLHDTPAAVTVIDRHQLDNLQIRTLSELARTDAALGDSYAPVGYYQNISIRGFPLDPATGYRMNDLNVVGEQNVALEGVQRVEILQGLAGIDAGVMSPGGAVDYIAKRPADVHTLTLGTDSHGSRYGALDVGGWLTPTFGLRANLGWESIHSYVVHDPGRRNFYTLAADWRISPKASLELDADRQHSAQRSVSGYQLLGGTVVPPHASATTLLGYEPWQQPETIQTLNTSARFAYTFNRDWRLRLAAGHSRSYIDDNVAFAYGCFYVPECAALDTTRAVFAPNGDYDVYDWRSPDENYLDDQARATIAGHVDSGAVRQDLTFTAGTFQRDIEGHNPVFNYVGTANIDQAQPPLFPPSPAEPGKPRVQLFDARERTLAALDRIHFGDHWQVIAGVNAVRLHEVSRGTDGTLQLDTQMHQVLPQAAILWLPVQALTAYASYGEGLALGKQAPYWTSNSGATLAPRKTSEVETGLKYRAGPRLDLEATLYQIREPYQFAEPDAAGTFTFVQRGQETHAGMELSANGEMTANLGVHASLSFIRARATGTGVPAFEGHQVINVPRLRTAAYLTYRLPRWPALTVLGGWRYASPNTASADGAVRVPAYNVFDAGIAWRSTWQRHPTTVRLTLDNVFDRFYWRDAVRDPGGDSYLFPGAPRLARLSVEIAL